MTYVNQPKSPDGSDDPKGLFGTLMRRILLVPHRSWFLLRQHLQDQRPRMLPRILMSRETMKSINDIVSTSLLAGLA